MIFESIATKGSYFSSWLFLDTDLLDLRKKCMRLLLLKSYGRLSHLPFTILPQVLSMRNLVGFSKEPATWSMVTFSIVILFM